MDLGKEGYRDLGRDGNRDLGKDGFWEIRIYGFTEGGKEGKRDIGRNGRIGGITEGITEESFVVTRLCGSVVLLKFRNELCYFLC